MGIEPGTGGRSSTFLLRSHGSLNILRVILLYCKKLLYFYHLTNSALTLIGIQLHHKNNDDNRAKCLKIMRAIEYQPRMMNCSSGRLACTMFLILKCKRPRFGYNVESGCTLLHFRGRKYRFMRILEKVLLTLQIMSKLAIFFVVVILLFQVFILVSLVIYVKNLYEAHFISCVGRHKITRCMHIRMLFLEFILP